MPLLCRRTPEVDVGKNDIAIDLIIPLYCVGQGAFLLILAVRIVLQQRRCNVEQLGVSNQRPLTEAVRRNQMTPKQFQQFMFLSALAASLCLFRGHAYDSARHASIIQVSHAVLSNR
jgi:hypothetical protein